MTKHIYLIQEKANPLIVVVSEKERPNILHYVIIKSDYNGDRDLWLKTASKYPIANPENEKMFIDFIGGYKHKTNGLNLSDGIEIKSENIKFFVATDGPKKGTTLAYFVPEPISLIEETQNDLWKEANKLYNTKEHTQDGRDLQMKNFTIERIKTK